MSYIKISKSAELTAESDFCCDVKNENKELEELSLLDTNPQLVGEHDSLLCFPVM